jgi:hypothetical protein
MILNSITDRSKWLKIFNHLPLELRDIYYHPDYVSLNCLDNNSEGYLFYVNKDSNFWIKPFIKKLIPNLLEKKITNFFDLETPYGYGGPISNTTNSEFIKFSNSQFSDWTKSQNIVAEFVRFHPILNSYKFIDNKFDIIEERTTCNIKIEDVDNNLNPFKSKVKNMIRKAMQNTVGKISKDYLDYEIFVKLYLKSMKKKRAKDEVFFSEKYFKDLFDLVKSAGFMSVIKKKENSEILAVGIFLSDKQYSHYHLSASSDSLYQGISNLLIYNASLHLKRLKIRILHLGGGNTNFKDDNLFKFKKSMSTDLQKYYIGKRIYDLDLYAQIKESWKIKYPSNYSKNYKKLLCYHDIN